MSSSTPLVAPSNSGAQRRAQELYARSPPGSVEWLAPRAARQAALVTTRDSPVLVERRAEGVGLVRPRPQPQARAEAAFVEKRRPQWKGR